MSASLATREFLVHLPPRVETTTPTHTVTSQPVIVIIIQIMVVDYWGESLPGDQRSVCMFVMNRLYGVLTLHPGTCICNRYSMRPSVL